MLTQLQSARSLPGMAENNVPLVSQYASEFVGTFLLVMVMALVAGQSDATQSDAALYGPLAIGAVLTVLVYSLGRVSGGYFNPAITLAAAYQRIVQWRVALTFIVIQMVAGIAGALVNRLIFGFDKDHNPKVGPPSINFSPIDMIQCPMIELFYTFMLSFVVLNVAYTAKNKSSVEREFSGLCIGFVVVAGAYGAGRVSGGYFNPAAAVGIDVAHLINSKEAAFLYSALYAAGQVTGAFLSVTALHIVRKESQPSGEGLEKYHPLKLALKIESYCKPELATEFLGVFFLTYTFGSNVMANDWAAKNPGIVPTSPGALSVGAAVMVMVYAAGDVSGGHFNPAVTLAVFLSGRSKPFSLKKVAIYCAIQLVAACLGGVAYWLCFFNTKDDQHINVVSVDGTGGLQGLLAEFFMTFILCYVVLSVAQGPSKLKSYHGFAIGSTIIAGGMALGSITYGFINPAITLGAAVVSFPRCFENFNWLLYVLGQLLGGAAAAGLSKYVTHQYEYDETHNPLADPLWSNDP